MTARIFRGWLGGTALSLAIGAMVPLAAQQSDQPQGQDDEQQQQQQQQRRQRRERQQQRAEQQRGQRRQPGRAGGRPAIRVEPEGWVEVMVDYAGDGRVDRVETIYVLDLERATQASAMRRRGRPMPSGQPIGQVPLRRIGRPAGGAVQGTLKNLTETKLTGMGNQPHLLARVETEQGRTVRVHLGAKSALKDLDLQEGDTVTVHGARGLINDRPMLMATRVETDGRYADVRMPRDRALRRFHGEIAALRTTSLKGKDEDYVVARMRVQRAREYPAILGPILTASAPASR